MALEVLSPRTLLGVFRDERLASPSSYWRDIGGFTANVFQSNTQDIVFEKITAERKLAPFVQPTVPGKPIYKRRGSAAQLFQPAYIKPKDTVNPGEQFTRRPGNLFDDTPRTPQQNWDDEIATILGYHRNTIERTWEWMAAQAIIYAGVTVEYEDGASVYIDFARAAANEEIKVANFWDETYDIVKDVQEYSNIMNAAEFGGIAHRMTIGREVWTQMQKNEKLLALMDTTVRGGNVTMERSLIDPLGPDKPFQRVGVINTVEVILYNDFYQNDAGTQVDFLNPRDIVLTSGNVGGVMAFGAILDAKAGLKPQPVFSKMWDQEDPSATVIMSQSAPLAISTQPNRTFHARVVQEDSNS